MLFFRVKGTYPEETGVVSPVPCCLVEHVWGEDTRDDADDVAAKVSFVGGFEAEWNLLAVAGEYDSLDLQTAR